MTFDTVVHTARFFVEQLTGVVPQTRRKTIGESGPAGLGKNRRHGHGHMTTEIMSLQLRRAAAESSRQALTPIQKEAHLEVAHSRLGDRRDVGVTEEEYFADAALRQ